MSLQAPYLTNLANKFYNVEHFSVFLPWAYDGFVGMELFHSDLSSGSKQMRLTPLGNRGWHKTHQVIMEYEIDL